jgi:hypothetical protein
VTKASPKWQMNIPQLLVLKAREQKPTLAFTLRGLLVDVMYLATYVVGTAISIVTLVQYCGGWGPEVLFHDQASLPRKPNTRTAWSRY